MVSGNFSFRKQDFGFDQNQVDPPEGSTKIYFDKTKIISSNGFVVDNLNIDLIQNFYYIGYVDSEKNKIYSPQGNLFNCQKFNREYQETLGITWNDLKDVSDMI
mgnify:CR=1 FL=1